MSKLEVKTTQSFEEWELEEVGLGADPEKSLERRRGWEAAIASVMLSEGKRFEVGDKAIGLAGRVGRIEWVPEQAGWGNCIDPANVYPLPQTVNLTMEEKFKAIIERLAGGPPPYDSVEALNQGVSEFGRLHIKEGRSIDQLCQEYGIPTTKELP